MTPQPPTQRVGDFQIRDFVGAGGMGAVFRAVHARTGQQGAVKFLQGDAARNLKSRQRFAHEARVQASLKHPRLAAFYEWHEINGAPCHGNVARFGRRFRHRSGPQKVGKTDRRNAEQSFACRGQIARPVGDQRRATGRHHRVQHHDAGALSGQLYNVAADATSQIAGAIKADGSFFFKYSYAGVNYIAKDQLQTDGQTLAGSAGFSTDGQNAFGSGEFELRRQ